MKILSAVSDLLFTSMTLSEIKEQTVNGVVYKYSVYDAVWDDGEFPISGQMIVDENMIPISFWILLT